MTEAAVLDEENAWSTVNRRFDMIPLSSRSFLVLVLALALVLALTLVAPSFAF